MPSATVTLYSDYKSPYAFVAKAAAYALEDDFDIALDWLPYTLDIPSYLGSVENRDAHQWRKVRYAYMDARRYANKQGLTLKGPRKIYDTRTAQTGMLFAKMHGVFHPYHDDVFERFWSHEIEIEDVSEVVAAIDAAGAPGAEFSAFLAGDGGAAHDRIRAAAEEAGIFGVPMFVFDGELFFGGDRIELLRERLSGRGLTRG
ncbi:MAG TPA: DsbA family protein [Alphaproteobacteria bacterium]|nr:DsbA family protein [Alphaproteobacteria bacterium]